MRRMERRSAADLDGMGLFVRIVDHGSLSAAGRALGIPKATLSREATWSGDLLLPIARHGVPEESYFTFTYSPIRDETGGIGGIGRTSHPPRVDSPCAELATHGGDQFQLRHRPRRTRFARRRDAEMQN